MAGIFPVQHRPADMIAFAHGGHGIRPEVLLPLLPFSSTVLRFKKGRPASGSPFVFSDRSLDTPFHRVRFDAAFDTQFGYLERSTHDNNAFEEAKFEVCGHKWADLSEESFGAALLNDCKYGYRVKEGELSLSLKINIGNGLRKFLKG